MKTKDPRSNRLMKMSFHIVLILLVLHLAPTQSSADFTLPTGCSVDQARQYKDLAKLIIEERERLAESYKLLESLGPYPSGVGDDFFNYITRRNALWLKINNLVASLDKRMLTLSTFAAKCGNYALGAELSWVIAPSNISVSEEREGFLIRKGCEIIEDSVESIKLLISALSDTEKLAMKTYTQCLTNNYNLRRFRPLDRLMLPGNPCYDEYILYKKGQHQLKLLRTQLLQITKSGDYQYCHKHDYRPLISSPGSSTSVRPTSGYSNLPR